MDWKESNIITADLVSIIVPVYNSQEYLSRCLESAIDQSYKNIEILLINDGSTDNSGKICDGHAISDNRIRVIHTKNNGPAAARNIGIDNSKGEFIFFLDSDDSIEKNAIHLLIENYQQTKADIIIGDFDKMKDDVITNSEHNTYFTNSKLLTKQDIVDYIRCYLKKPNRFPLFVYSWGRLFKSSIIKNNNILFATGLRTFEDVVFNFDYLDYTNEIFFAKEVVYHHSIHDNYASTAMRLLDDPEILFGYPKALIKTYHFLRHYCFDDAIKKEIGHAYVCYTIIQLVRTCGQINNSNKNGIYKFVKNKINNPTLRNNLQFYTPSGDDSKILPILMKLKLTWLIIWVCKYKAYKRYKKL